MRVWWRWCLLGWLLLTMGGAQADDFLEPEQAFKVAARTAPDGALVLQFEVAQGYYLYREPLRFAAGDRLLAPVLPPGQRKFDETFQKEVETYRDRLVVRLEDVADVKRLNVTAQGCADKGLCYAPATVILSRQPGGEWTMTPSAPMAPMLGVASWQALAGAPDSGPRAASLSSTLWGAFLDGLALWLTPAAWPVWPALVGLMVGFGATAQRGQSQAHVLALALAYASGLALVFAVLGAWAAWAGVTGVAALQGQGVRWAVLSVMSALALAALSALSALRWPGAAGAGLFAFGQAGRGRALGLTLAAGALSPVALGVVLAPPFVAALLRIEQGSGLASGAGAMFVMAWGLSLPLMLVAVPAAGWVARCRKRVLGVTLLMVASLLMAALALLRPHLG